MAGTQSDIDRGKSKEQTTQKGGKDGAGFMVKEGQSKNPTKSGGINRPTTGKY